MTDSGFSSAASNRSLSSVIKPGLLNQSNAGSTVSTGHTKESSGQASCEGFYSIPRPATYLQTAYNKPILTNRFLSNNSNGGYSPGIYSPKDMSPMSSLALDFRDLNTSRDASDTPRKRLSLSSVSSLESPHLIPSPAFSLGSSKSPYLLQDDEGFFTETPSPVDLAEVEAKFDHRPLQDKDINVCDSTKTRGDGKLCRYRRFKSMPASSVSQFRFPLSSQHEHVGKENNPAASSIKQTFSKQHSMVDSPSPMQSKLVASPSPFHTLTRRRHSAMVMSPTMTSSPLAPNFSSSTSSAFSTVQHSSTTGLTRRPSTDISTRNQEEVEKAAEKQLRDAKSPTNGSRTPVKSVVPGSISSLSARARVISRPASAAPFYGGAYNSGRLSPIPVRAIKRSLDSSNTSQAASIKRHKRSLTSSIESSATRRKMAFSSNERKIKSAEAAFMHSSPVDNLKASFRPISAPAEMLNSDDDAPLTHSRLCSSNDADSDSDDAMMTSSLDHDRSDAEEKLLEEMLNETAQSRSDRRLPGDTNGRGKSGTPLGLAGLITAPLLLSATVLENKENDDNLSTERLPKPRELFRSPSAPPVVSSRRSAIKRVRQQAEGGTPFGRRCQSGCDRRSIPTLPEVTSHEIDEEPSTVLNRSRSFNELDIMRAVEVGCSDPNLVGDFSRACSLKTVGGKHQDLKYITVQTLIDDLIEKKHDSCYEIIDCRYPYEYEGGHVIDAKSVWEEAALFKRYFHNPKPMWAAESNGTYKPPVLVFYCEFSSERGPRMARALRNKDRSLNAYPHLHYPEIYVLKDGYKKFFHTEGSEKYCEPSSYRPMAHEDFARELRMCRIKSKTWAGEKTKCGLYNRLKHL